MLISSLIYRSSQTHLSLLQNEQHQSDTDTDIDRTTSSKEPQSEHVAELETEDEERSLRLIKSNTIQFFTLHQTENKWKRSLTTRVELMHAIESFRNAIMIPVKNQTMISHMKNGTFS